MAHDSEDSAGEKQKLEMPPIDEIDTPEFDSKLEKLKEYSEVVKAFQRFKEPKSQLQNPLSEVTRKERKGLLASTLLAFVIAILNIKPDEITAIGFNFDIENIESFYIVLIIVIIYFIFAFISYAASDFIEWRLAIQEKTEEWKSDIDIKPYVEESSLVSSPDKYDLDDLNFDPSTLEKSAKPISYFRAFIEFGVPILFAISTIILIACNYA